ncbi:MAG: hypothetical protein NW241_02490 [Bacteroidia bacterium]|nr:hypothetical protein [Bacteroidia bacterium]
MQVLAMPTRRTVFLLAVLLSSACLLPAQTFDWARAWGGTEEDQAFAVAVGDSGQVYLTGGFRGTADADPGPGSSPLASAGEYDVFVQKLDAQGNFLWAAASGGTSDDFGAAIAIGDSGQVYVLGFFSGTADFDPGPGVSTLTSAGNIGLFVQKLNADGSFRWARSWGGVLEQAGASIALDDSGHVYLTGGFEGTVDFDPGPGVSTRTSAGAYDIFVQKLDAQGNFLWVQAWGGTSSDFGTSVISGDSGSVYLTGVFAGTADFDLGPGSSPRSSAGGDDVFVQKLDAQGNFLWARTWGGASDDRSNAVTADAAGAVYTTGWFAGTADADPGPGSSPLAAAGGVDIFVQKLDAQGNFLWAAAWGGTSDEEGFSIAADASGQVYTTGVFAGTADFDPGPGSSPRSSAGGDDVFVQCMDAQDHFLWARTWGGIANDGGASIAADAAGQVYTAGSFAGTVDFDPGTGSSPLTAAGAEDIFVQNMRPCAPSAGTDVIRACAAYTWIDGITYTASDSTATFMLSNAEGCDSVVTLNLTLNAVADITTTVAGFTITANNPNASYRWLNCAENYAPIEGANSQAFTAAANGSYAVELTENGCTDTSACVTMTSVGLDDPGDGINAIVLSPNPAFGTFILRSPQAAIESLTLYDLRGRRLSAEIRFDRHEAQVRSGYRGLALVQVQTSQGMWMRKVQLE